MKTTTCNVCKYCYSLAWDDCPNCGSPSANKGSELGATARSTSGVSETADYGPGLEASTSWLSWLDYLGSVCVFVIGLGDDKRFPRAIFLWLGVVGLWLALIGLGINYWSREYVLEKIARMNFDQKERIFERLRSNRTPEQDKVDGKNSEIVQIVDEIKHYEGGMGLWGLWGGGWLGILFALWINFTETFRTDNRRSLDSSMAVVTHFHCLVLLAFVSILLMIWQPWLFFLLLTMATGIFGAALAWSFRK